MNESLFTTPVESRILKMLLSVVLSVVVSQFSVFGLHGTFLIPVTGTCLQRNLLRTAYTTSMYCM